MRGKSIVYTGQTMHVYSQVSLELLSIIYNLQICKLEQRQRKAEITQRGRLKRLFNIFYNFSLQTT